VFKESESPTCTVIFTPTTESKISIAPTVFETPKSILHHGQLGSSQSILKEAISLSIANELAYSHEGT
jgi:hypothetical protein